MLFLKRPQHRVFDYTPRHYNPEEDQDEKRKKRLRFRKIRKHSSRRKSPYTWIILFAIVIYFYLKFTGLI